MSGSTPKTPPVRIDSFPRPSTSNLRKIIISAAAMVLLAQPALLEPGSLLHDGLLLLSDRPQVLKIARWVQAGGFYFIYGAHVLEAAAFAFVRLRRHGVPIFSLLGLKWLAAVFVGGKFAWAHFDEVVAKKAIGGGRSR